MNDTYDPTKPKDSTAVPFPDNFTTPTGPSISVPSIWLDYYKPMTYVSIENGELTRLYEIERKYKAMRDLLHKLIDEVIDIASDNG